MDTILPDYKKQKGCRIVVVAALASNRVIGDNGKLPWHLPEDLRRFKRLTMGHSMIMGRKTFESINRTLPGRNTLIISRDPEYRVDGCQCFDSPQAALTAVSEEPEVFVVGGGKVYAEVLPAADRLCLTELFHAYDGDVFFPEFSLEEFSLVKEERREDSVIPHCYREYCRKSLS